MHPANMYIKLLNIKFELKRVNDIFLNLRKQKTALRHKHSAMQARIIGFFKRMWRGRGGNRQKNMIVFETLARLPLHTNLSIISSLHLCDYFQNIIKHKPILEKSPYFRLFIHSATLRVGKTFWKVTYLSRR